MRENARTFSPNEPSLLQIMNSGSIYFSHPLRSRPCIAARLRFFLRFSVIVSLLAAPRIFAASQPISYLLDLRHPPTHRMAVTMTVAQAPPATQIQFPAWNALYQIRDFVRGVQHVTAQCDGRPDKLLRVDLNTWRSTAEPCATLEVRYDVYINEEGIFSSVLNQDHCYMNLAMLLFYLPQEREREAHIRFLLPGGWMLATLLDDGKKPGEYAAPNYDALVDSPAEAAPAPRSATEGPLHEFSYVQNGATYRAVVYADPADYSPDRLLASLQKITAAETALMHDVPFSRYTFILHFPRGPGGGGMEHKNGAAISVPANRLRSDWGSFESVAAHEFFHAWNVKRVRPQNLEPVDYIHGNDTRDLWFSEGVTSTYGDLTLLRAGLIPRQEFYRRLGDEIRNLQQRPARLWQSVEESGREAWLEKYPDYHRPERSISYYNKGELVGFLLDLAIRHSTGGQHSLDDVMRGLNTDFAQRGRFFTQSDLRAMIAGIAPTFTGLDEFFHDYVEGTAELDYGAYLGFAGLRVVSAPANQAAPGFRLLHQDGETFEARSVDPDGNAGRAGLKNGDTLVQMNGRAVTGATQDELDQMNPSQKLQLRVRRGSQTLKIKFSLGTRQETEYRIEEIPAATAEQLEVRAGWLQDRTAGR
jgi:predicted metalloprotease with PDZ domain